MITGHGPGYKPSNSFYILQVFKLNVHWFLVFYVYNLLGVFEANVVSCLKSCDSNSSLKSNYLCSKMMKLCCRWDSPRSERKNVFIEYIKWVVWGGQTGDVMFAWSNYGSIVGSNPPPLQLGTSLYPNLTKLTPIHVNLIFHWTKCILNFCQLVFLVPKFLVRKQLPFSNDLMQRFPSSVTRLDFGQLF